jgi:integrase
VRPRPTTDAFQSPRSERKGTFSRSVFATTTRSLAQLAPCRSFETGHIGTQHGEMGVPRVSGWTTVAAMTPLRSDRRSNDPTTVALLEAYWKVHWSAFSPSHRSKTRGRLIIMAASLMEPSSSSKGVLRALRDPNQRGSRSSERPHSPEARAACYLRTHFLPRHDGASKKSHSELRKQDGCATWIDAHSKLATEIDDEDLTRLRIDLGGTTYQTRRTYWSIIEAVLHWAMATGRLDRDPSIGLPKIRRMIEVEKPGADRVPEEGEIWEIAQIGRAILGDWFSVAVLLGGYGALRAGELVALRPENLVPTESGGLWLTVAAQHRQFAKRHSDDGISTTDIAPPKGRIAGPAASRRCYIPAAVAAEISDYVSRRRAHSLLFVSHRGRAFRSGTFRDAWNRVIAALPVGHRLQQITPHSLRHAGMSMWLRKGVDLKLIQAWGGWYSLKVMLDTYAALLPGAEEDSIALLEGRQSSPRPVSFPSDSQSTPKPTRNILRPGISHWSLHGPTWSG